MQRRPDARVASAALLHTVMALTLLPHTSLAMSVVGSQLMASTQIAQLDVDGTIAIPADVRANITGLLVDIGCLLFVYTRS